MVSFPASDPERVDHLQERESVKIRIPGANPSNSMLPHQNCRIGVMEQVAREIGEFLQGLPGNLRVSVRVAKTLQPGRQQKGIHKGRDRGVPSRSAGQESVTGVSHRPGGSKDPWMGQIVRS